MTTTKILAYVRWAPETDDDQWAGGPIVEFGFRLSFCGFHYARVWPVRGGCWCSTGYLGNDTFGAPEAAKIVLTNRLVLHIEAVDAYLKKSLKLDYVDSCIQDFLTGKVADGWNTRRGPIFPEMNHLDAR